MSNPRGQFARSTASLRASASRRNALRAAVATALAGLVSSAVAGPFPAEIDLADLLPANGGDGTAGFALRGNPDPHGPGAPIATSDAGDVNGDVQLARFRFALTDDDTTFDRGTPGGPAVPSPFTTTDTRGCSCSQIITQLGHDAGERAIGCELATMREWINQIDSHQ